MIQVKDWKEGNQVVKKLLHNPEKLEEIHKKTLSWWKDKCSEKATAQYIVENINNLEQN